MGERGSYFRGERIAKVAIASVLLLVKLLRVRFL